MGDVVRPSLLYRLNVNLEAYTVIIERTIYGALEFYLGVNIHSILLDCLFIIAFSGMYLRNYSILYDGGSSTILKVI